jgi:hypothetical protein
MQNPVNQPAETHGLIAGTRPLIATVTNPDLDSDAASKWPRAWRLLLIIGGSLLLWAAIIAALRGI